MYDILETNLSFIYLNKISKIKNGIMMGGWAVYFYVNENYKRAFGIDYLKSRDIDVFVKFKYLQNFIKEIKNIGFVPSSYFFRYELIYDRNKKKILNEKEAKKEKIYNLIYVFLDLFSDKKNKNAWRLDILSKLKSIIIDNVNVVAINDLLAMKCISFFEREKLDKELKDACDIYALLMYSDKKLKINENVKKTIEKIIKRKDLMDFIAENVLRDITKANIVNASLEKFLKK